jgi:chromosomal replication initiator protein
MKNNISEIRQAIRDIRKKGYVTNDLISKLVNNINEIATIEATCIFFKKQAKKLNLMFQPSEILQTVSDVYRCSVEDIQGNARTKEIADARHLSIYLCRTELGFTFQASGDCVNRNHATAMHSIRKIEGLLKTDIKLCAKKDEIIKQLNGIVQ